MFWLPFIGLYVRGRWHTIDPTDPNLWPQESGSRTVRQRQFESSNWATTKSSNERFWPSLGLGFSMVFLFSSRIQAKCHWQCVLAKWLNSFILFIVSVEMASLLSASTFAVPGIRLSESCWMHCDMFQIDEWLGNRSAFRFAAGGFNLQESKEVLEDDVRVKLHTPPVSKKVHFDQVWHRDGTIGDGISSWSHHGLCIWKGHSFNKIFARTKGNGYLIRWLQGGFSLQQVRVCVQALFHDR